MKVDHFGKAMSLIESAKAITTTISAYLCVAAEGGITNTELSQAMDEVSLLLNQANEEMQLDLKESEA